MALIKQQTEADVFISERFQQAVSLHVLKNLLKRVEAQVPLLLGIHRGEIAKNDDRGVEAFGDGVGGLASFLKVGDNDSGAGALPGGNDLLDGGGGHVLRPGEFRDDLQTEPAAERGLMLRADDFLAAKPSIGDFPSDDG